MVHVYHLILTMDVLILDECGQLSAQQVKVIDLVLRHARRTNIPFGGVLIFGTFDHAQLGAIEGLPFILSSHILTDFTMVRLKHSVRAHTDPNLQRIQEITRMSPYALRGNQQLETEFKTLVGEHLTFHSSWDDSTIPPNALRVYSKRKEAATAAHDYVSTTEEILKKTSVQYVISNAVDQQRVAYSRSQYRLATDEQLLQRMDKSLKEPRKLIFYAGAQFEATINGKGYDQSQLLLMMDVPTISSINAFGAITLLAAPIEVIHYNINLEDGLPSKASLIDKGWKEVRIKTGREELILHQSNEGCRRQYSLRHVISSTINRQMGNTLSCPVAIEITPKCCPWEKGQVVVMLSRTKTSTLIHIVGNKKEAINIMWINIMKHTQWARLVETLLNNLSIDGDGVAPDPNFTPGAVQYGNHYPYSMGDVELPCSHSGYVYLLMSMRAHGRMYVGECQHLGDRLNDHNNNTGSVGTAPTIYKPYTVVAYIGGLGEYSRNQRMSLEHHWQQLNQFSIQSGDIDVISRVKNGETVVNSHNAGRPPREHITFVEFISTDRQDATL